MADKAKIVIRKATEADESFIYSTWLKGNYFGNSFFRRVNQDLRFRNYNEYIRSVLKSKDYEINVACDESTPEWAVGYSVIKKDILYWIHIKEDYRRMGIGTLLLGGKKIIVVEVKAKIGTVETKGDPNDK